MPIVGFSISSIGGRKNKAAVRGEIKVNSTPKINDVKEVSIPAFNKKPLSLSFDFVTKYEPNLAEVKISGDVLYLAENNQKILNEWKKKKALPEAVSVEVLNHLFRRCLIKIAGLADELQLPPPLQIPRVKTKSDEAGYIG
jgi:hypothetical protein